jgi:hypothetical protein
MTGMLNKAYAEAVYSAMVALNNVSGRIRVQFDLKDRTTLYVQENDTGGVTAHIWDAPGNRLGDSAECYEDQHAFAAAYGLDN